MKKSPGMPLRKAAFRGMFYSPQPGVEKSLLNLSVDRIEIWYGGAYNGSKGVRVMLDMIEFGKRLRSARRAHGLTQKMVAGGIRVSEQAISKWEQGDSHT